MYSNTWMAYKLSIASYWARICHGNMQSEPKETRGVITHTPHAAADLNLRRDSPTWRGRAHACRPRRQTAPICSRHQCGAKTYETFSRAALALLPS